MNSGRSIAVPKQLGAVEKLANGKWQMAKKEIATDQTDGRGFPLFVLLILVHPCESVASGFLVSTTLK
jgi:hypothetical protein